MTTGRVTAQTRRGPFWRLAGTALLAATFGIAGHVVGAGEVPTATPILLGVVAIAAGATGLARWSGARRRRCWEAITLLWSGQLAVETLLICDSGMLTRPLAAAAVHVATGLLVGGLLLGGRRILDDTIARPRRAPAALVGDAGGAGHGAPHGVPLPGCHSAPRWTTCRRTYRPGPATTGLTSSRAGSERSTPS